MKDLIHTILTAQDRVTLCKRFKDLHYRPLKGKNKKLDTLVEVIFDFFDVYGEVPTPFALAELLSSSNQHDMVGFLQEIVGEGKPRAPEELSEFSAVAARHAKLAFQKDMNQASSDMQQMLVSVNSGGSKPQEFLESQITALRQLRSKYSEEGDGLTDVLFGMQSKEEAKLRYLEKKRKLESGEIAYFDLGLGSHFDTVLFEFGDLITFGGYTSHGKSIHLRRLCYHFAVNYALNVPFLTLEMDINKVKDLFFLHHANNKRIFPNTPKISSFKHKTGRLNKEEREFLFEVAAEDFTSNPNYGTIQLIQPTKTPYTLDDLRATLSRIEMEEMPIDAIGLDYLSMITPSFNGKAVRGDATEVNQMIKAFKQMLITHRNAHGDISPIMGITAHQISRQGFETAMKNDRMYDSKAFHMHSEIEKSSDWLFTTLMTNEMKQNKENRLQALKGRDSEVPYEPCDLFIDLDHGFAMDQAHRMSEDDIANAVASLDI